MNAILLTMLAPLSIVPAMGLLSRIRSRSPIGRELRRKALHVGIGLASLSFPYLLDRPWMVVAGLLLAAAWLQCVRASAFLARRFGRCLAGARRESHGELYFALALAGLLLVTGPGSPSYVVPVLVLTLADTAAAVVGTAMPVGSYRVAGRQKTIAGTLAFVVSAFAVSLPALVAAGQTVPSAAHIALGLSLAAAAAEAVSTRGLDNLTVPFVTWLVLETALTGA